MEFEIFKTGDFTDMHGTVCSFTETDLDHIAAAYNPQEYEAPLVIGHPALEAPAYGWVEGLRREGDRLLASVQQVLPEFAELVNSGAYKKISIALAPGGLLRHVGFLGATAPAVPGLRAVSFSSLGQDIWYDQQEVLMPVKDTSADPDPLIALRAEIEALKNNLSQLQEIKTATTSVHNPERTLQFASYLDQKTASGCLTPVQKNAALAVVFASQKENPCDIDEALKNFIESLPHQYLFSEAVQPASAGKGQLPESAFEKACTAIRSAMTHVR